MSGRKAWWAVLAVSVAALMVAGAMTVLRHRDRPIAAAAAAVSTSAVPIPPTAVPTTVTPTTSPPPPTSPAPPPPRTGLAAAATRAAEGAARRSTQLAVAVLDRRTGEMSVGGRGAEPYYTASLAKVVVAVDVLDRRRLDGLAVTAADLDLFRRALGPSDDSAMNALWTHFDGPHAAGRVSARLKLAGTSDPRDPSQWGEMNVPAADTVRIWHYILDGMPAADRDLLIADMQAAPARARDGFDQAFGLLDPEVDGGDGPGAVAKQGWMCCFSGEYYLHSAGAVGPDKRFLVAILTRVPRAGGWEAAREELDRIAEAAVAPLD